MPTRKGVSQLMSIPWPYLSMGLPTVSKRVHGHQHMSDVRLGEIKHLVPVWRMPAISTYVDFVMLEAKLQVVVDGFIRDLAQQCKIRNTNILLLCCLKCGLLDLRFSRLSPITYISDLRATEASTLLLPANRTS